MRPIKPPTIEELFELSEKYRSFADATKPFAVAHRENLLISHALKLWTEACQRKQDAVNRRKQGLPNPAFRKDGGAR